MESSGSGFSLRVSPRLLKNISNQPAEKSSEMAKIGLDGAGQCRPFDLSITPTPTIVIPSAHIGEKLTEFEETTGSAGSISEIPEKFVEDEAAIGKDGIGV